MSDEISDLQAAVVEIQVKLAMCENMLRAAVLMMGAMLGLDVSVYM